MTARRLVLSAFVWLAIALVAGEVAVRALGFALRRDVVVAPAAGGDAIYCIGDSFTYGQGVQRNEAWPQLLGKRLQETMGTDAAPAVRTLAEPGRSSSVALVEVAKALQAKDARLVLVLTGWNANDGDFAAHAEALRQPVPWTASADLWLQHSHLYRVVKQAVTYQSRTVVFDGVKIVPQTTAMSLYDFRAYQEIGFANLRQIARLCKATNVPCAFLTYPHQRLPPNPYTPIEYYHALFGRTPIGEDDYLVHDRLPDEIAIDAIIRKVAESEGVPLIDLQPAFARAQQPGLFQADYHHPTAPGHVLMAQTVFDAIAAGLRR